MNLQEKTFVKVFVTKNMKFRAVINEPNQPAYEVSINGESWKNGKGRQHEPVIRNKIKLILETLTKENICLTSN